MIYLVQFDFFYSLGMRCVSHTLQLAVIDCLKEASVNAVLNKVRALVKKLRNQTYMYLIKKEKLKTPILDCLTRWHSTCDMLERIQDLKVFIKNMSANDKKLKSFCLNSNEWQHVETIFKALLPAKICTKNLQSEQLTLTDFYGEWIACKFKTEAQNSSFAQKLLQFMISREKFILNNKVFVYAIFLDPRYKITLNEEQCLISIEHLIKVWIQLNKLQSDDNGNYDIDLNNQPSIDEHFDNSDSDSTDVVEQFLKSKSTEIETLEINSSQTSVIFTQIETILKNYNIHQKRINYKTDILKFWKSMEYTHPELYQLASVVFCVPATQVSVERLFSGLKFVLSPYRTNISSKHLEDQLLIRTNKLFEKKRKTTTDVS